MAIVYLSLGSNKGDRIGYIQQATSIIGGLETVNIIRSSSFYESEPWGTDSKNWYVNAILEIKTSLNPHELLNSIHKIEAQLGRNREIEGHYGDRTIDIDIIFYDKAIINDDDLIIPHKYFHKRAFTLVPMLELEPDFVHPILKKNILELHDTLENPEMVCLYGTRVRI
ncbi:2-amino-4-hydroxy-6-hydroxymethyldihydropteridine diphosphokinase [bacterium]|nr:2-amino-4-hydroxy-6-hydroxymethyldihydropteridine diphosphokinase [bacterium]